MEDEELRFDIIKSDLPGKPTELFVPKKVWERLHAFPGGLVFSGKGIRLLLETPLESNQKDKKDGWSLAWNGKHLEITWAERMPDDKIVFRSMAMARVHS